MTRLLIVDDNPGDRLLLVELLDDVGVECQVVEVGSLGEARGVLSPELDAVVLDIRLPDGNGADFVREIRAELGTIAILVLSGTAHEREAIEAVRAGAYDYLKKDALDPRVLSSTLRGALEQAAAQRELAAERAALAESEARFRAFAELIPEPSWSSDAAGMPRMVNAQWQERFGAACPWVELVDDSARAEASRAWQEALVQRRPLQLRVPLNCRAGIRRYLVRALPADSPSTAWYATLTDIEDLEAARIQLERTSRGKDNFMAILGHELRNPLGVLSMAVDALEREPSSVVGRLPLLRRQLAVIERITDDLYDASRFVTGRETLHTERVDLSRIVLDAVAATRQRLDERDMRLQLDVSPNMELQGDSVRLTQVISNLLVNAAKYGREQGTVWVQLERGTSLACLRVCDDGPGIEPDLMPVLFEPFTRSDRDRSGSQGGLGLGLSIAHRLIELHGGTISASDREGGGTVMTVKLPLTRADDEPA